MLVLMTAASSSWPFHQGAELSWSPRWHLGLESTRLPCGLSFIGYAFALPPLYSLFAFSAPCSTFVEIGSLTPTQTLPDSIDLYAQQVGRSGRDGRAAICLLFFNPHVLSPLRRAVERESVTLRDLQVASNVVWTAADPINRYVFVEAVELVRRGVPSPRVQAVLQLVAEASFVKVGPEEHGRGNLCRGPAWHLPPPPMSADAARLLVTLRVKFEPSATFFARICVADLTDSEPFDQLGLCAATACVGTVEELAASGVLKEPVEWRDVLYPVSNLRGSKPTDEELAVA